MYGSSIGLTEGNITDICLQTEEKLEKPVRIVGVPAEIRTEYFPNKNKKR
jgi:hypothetical protein